MKIKINNNNIQNKKIIKKIHATCNTFTIWKNVHILGHLFYVKKHIYRCK